MPYIKQFRRPYFDDALEMLQPAEAGDLNYIFTKLADRYWQQNGRNYQAFNDILGALEGAKLELYRRKVAPYEDQKIKENGDV